LKTFLKVWERPSIDSPIDSSRDWVEIAGETKTATNKAISSLAFISRIKSLIIYKNKEINTRTRAMNNYKNNYGEVINKLLKNLFF